MDYLLSVAAKAIVLPIDPAGVEFGISTSSLCSPLEPQDMDCSRICAIVPSFLPSIDMLCEAAASMRNMATLTRADAGFPGQSTRSANCVVMTKECSVLLLLSPAAEVPR